MNVFMGIMSVIVVGLVVWAIVEYVVDGIFNINDLKDDDYGC